jgi:methionyl aminopeptidase
MCMSECVWRQQAFSPTIANALICGSFYACPRHEGSRELSIQDEQELASLKAAGRVVRMMLDAMKAEVRPGVTTRYLDDVGARVMRENGARSAPSMVYQFPGANCISLNDEAVHGVPGERELKEGDLVKLDVTVEKDGYMADAAITVPVGRVSPEAEKLIACAERAFHKAMLVARAGFRVFEIGKVVEREVRKSGFAVVRELGGHGIGRTIHEAPHVPNYADPEARQIMNEGLVITVEPIISSGSGRVFTDKDGWTVRTGDHALSAHFEHTLVVTSGAPILLTAG